ncbi:hypothetical protein HY630_03270 [Candidatus Uhrbacteria bacterium]|nr:hypothetical protein [Candidatus Uhrbacteria bacterium]
MASAAIPYLIDANVYVGFTNNEDSLHAQAMATLLELQNKGSLFILFDHVIQEILTVFLYSSQNTLVELFLDEAMSDLNVLTVDTPIEWLTDAMTLAAKHHFKPKMSTIDWLLLSRSIATGAPILTFDKQLLAASKKLC